MSDVRRARPIIFPKTLSYQFSLPFNSPVSLDTVTLDETGFSVAYSAAVLSRLATSLV